MNRTALRRLERLEKRQPTCHLAHLSDQELRDYLDVTFDRLVAEVGIAEVRSFVEQLPPALLDIPEYNVRDRIRAVEDAATGQQTGTGPAG